MRFRAIFVLLLLLFISRITFAFEGEMGGTLNFPAGQKTQADLYLLGWHVNISEEVNGDLFVLGGNVRVHGPVHGNVFIAGGSIEIDGPVDGDINLIGVSVASKSKCRACRMFGVSATNEGETQRDVLAFGALVTTNDTVHGDSLLGGGQINVSGLHDKGVFIFAHSAVISAKVKGDSRIDADSIVIDSKALLLGNLVYKSPRGLLGQVQNVKGTVTHEFPSPQLPARWHMPWLYLLSHKLFSALWLTVVGLVSLTWFPRSSQSVVDAMLHFPWESFGMGVLLIFAIPGISILLIVTLLGLPLGIFLFAVFGVGIYLTRLFASIYIGERVLGALEHHMPPYWQSLPLGVFLFTMLTGIPYIGIVVSVIAIPLALGAKALLASRLYRRMRSRHLA